MMVLAPTKVDLAWPGMSSSPSYVCSRKEFHDSGTTRDRSSSSPSPCASTVTEAEVWSRSATTTASPPSVASPTAGFTALETSATPRFPASTTTRPGPGTSDRTRRELIFRGPHPAWHIAYTPCHVPVTSFPFDTGMASGDRASSAATSPSHSLNFSKILHMSRRTAESQFSLRDRAQSDLALCRNRTPHLMLRISGTTRRRFSSPIRITSPPRAVTPRNVEQALQLTISKPFCVAIFNPFNQHSPVY
mmetsp:Transcript_25419/g.71285  ORF Transcript_25419/g.71285 Transcript_25419/m.71285 type:complete len:248 (-) Transcript_25419:3-746(-)